MASSLRIGVVFPQTEIAGDLGAAREYVAAVSELGYADVAAYDHVLGADPVAHRDWAGPDDVDTTFLEPFVLFGYAAALTSLELVTSIIIVPQRQTALVAKQAATLDLLCEGRLGVGVGPGGNTVEYEALGEEFSNRGARIGEQVELLRRLWTERSVTFHGEHDTVTGAGSLRFRFSARYRSGSGAVRSRRCGASEGLPMVGSSVRTRSDVSDALASIHESAVEAGRDPSSIGVEGRINAGNVSQETIAAKAAAWREAGATHLSVDTMGANLEGVEDHIAALAAAAAVILGQRSWPACARFGYRKRPLPKLLEHPVVTISADRGKSISDHVSRRSASASTRAAVAASPLAPARTVRG